MAIGSGNIFNTLLTQFKALTIPIASQNTIFTKSETSQQPFLSSLFSLGRQNAALRNTNRNYRASSQNLTVTTVLKFPVRHITPPS